VNGRLREFGAETIGRQHDLSHDYPSRSQPHIIPSMATTLRPRLAFQRVRDELHEQRKTGRAFVANQFELDLVEGDYGAWIKEVTRELKAGRYAPGPIEYCNAPKGGGLVRPGVRLQVVDRVVFTAAVGACLRRIYAATRWSQGTIDFATQINPNALSKRSWLFSPFTGWDQWRKESVECLEQGRTKYVLTADIAGYFENISIGILRSDLVRIGCNQDVISLVTKCLSHWALTEGRGLPQGVMASDIFAKLYLESFDKRLQSAGFAHVRYADDVRVFCRSEREARRALVVVTELLRERGLTLQSAKTKIREASGLKREFEGAVPAIQALNRDYIKETIALGMLESDPSVPVSVVDDLAGADPYKIDPKVIRRAFRRFVVRSASPDRTMRRFLLRRLAALNDDTAVDYCATLILTNPEASTEVLRYFEDLPELNRFERTLVSVLRNKDLNMYPYQQYLVLDWFWRNATGLKKPTLKTVRLLAFDGNTPVYVRIVAIALLGRFGDYSDLESIASLFAKSSDPLERAQLLCSLGRLEKGRRNALLGRVRDEKPWVDRAVALVRGSG
jgi:hypothetical protein